MNVRNLSEIRREERAYAKPLEGNILQYRVLWFVFFVLILPTVAISRVLPKRYRLITGPELNGSGKELSVVGEACEMTDTFIPMVFRA